MTSEPTINSRKPVGKLNAKDFEAFPVWEFAHDEEGIPGRDETWVRPTAKRYVRSNSYSQIVATDFRTCSGRELTGFMIVTTVKAVFDIQPGAIVGCKKYVPLVVKEDPDFEHFRKLLCDQIGEPAEKIYPMTFTLRAVIGREKTALSGTLK